MKIREIYESALRLLAESTGEGDNADYEERAPYIAAVFCNEAQALDASLRSFVGEAEAGEFDSIYLSLEAEFPLLPRFAGVCAMFIAAMLVSDSNAELSERLYAKYSDAFDSLCEFIGGVVEKIKDKYFSD